MLWFFSACDSFRTAGQFASGRRAFLTKNYQEALGHFQKVTDKNPNYVVLEIISATKLDRQKLIQSSE
jgi:hypothetical protein